MTTINKMKDTFGNNNKPKETPVHRGDLTVKKIENILSGSKKSFMLRFNNEIKLEFKELEKFISGENKVNQALGYISSIQFTINNIKKKYPTFNSLEFDNKLKDLIIPACEHAIKEHLSNLKTHIDNPSEYNDSYYVKQAEESIKYGRKMLEDLQENSKSKAFGECLDIAKKEFDGLKQPAFEVGIKLKLKELEESINLEHKLDSISLLIFNIQPNINEIKKQYPEFNSIGLDNQLKNLIIPIFSKIIEYHLKSLKNHIESPLNLKDILYLKNVEQSLKYGKILLTNLSKNSEAKALFECLGKAEQEFNGLKKQIKERYKKTN